MKFSPLLDTDPTFLTCIAWLLGLGDANFQCAQLESNLVADGLKITLWVHYIVAQRLSSLTEVHAEACPPHVFAPLFKPWWVYQWTGMPLRSCLFSHHILRSWMLLFGALHAFLYLCSMVGERERNWWICLEPALLQSTCCFTITLIYTVSIHSAHSSCLTLMKKLELTCTGLQFGLKLGTSIPEFCRNKLYWACTLETDIGAGPYFRFLTYR